MKAVVLHGPGDLRVDDLPEPDLPPGGLVVQPSHAGICGSDVRTWRHGSPRLAGPQVLGHEFAGVIVASDPEAVDAGLTVDMTVAVCPGAPCGSCRACLAGRANLCRSRRVLGYDLAGGMAERVAIPHDWVRTGGVVPLGPHVSPETGALVEPLHTVINGQDQAHLGPGDHVLVLGLGPIGILHAATARARGAASVVGVDPAPARVEAARAILSEVPVSTMDAAWQERIRGGLDGEGFDVVVVAAGSIAALDTALGLVQPGGRILAFAGLPPDAHAFDLDMNILHYRQLSLVGAFGGTPATFQRAAAWLADADLDVARFAPLRFPLVDAVAAFESVARGEGLKTLLWIDAT